VESGIRAPLLVQPGVVHHLGISILEKRGEQGRAALLRVSGSGIRGGFSRGGLVASAGCAFKQIRTRNRGGFTRAFAGGPSCGADLFGLAAQFPADRAAEESRVCGFRDISRAVVPESGAARERLART